MGKNIKVGDWVRIKKGNYNPIRFPDVPYVVCEPYLGINKSIYVSSARIIRIKNDSKKRRRLFNQQYEFSLYVLSNHVYIDTERYRMYKIKKLRKKLRYEKCKKIKYFYRKLWNLKVW